MPTPCYQFSTRNQQAKRDMSYQNQTIHPRVDAWPSLVMLLSLTDQEIQGFIIVVNSCQPLSVVDDRRFSV